MPNFVYDSTGSYGVLAYPKIDDHVTPGDNNKKVSANDWNAVNADLDDVRLALTSGSYFGFIRFPSYPSFAGANADYLWLRTDGTLMQHKRDGSDFQLSAVAANVTYTQYSEIASPAPPTSNPPSAILYLKNNGEVAGQSPLKRRTQLVVRWYHGAEFDTVIAESPAT
jgi:hypothetical protein